MHPSTRVVNLVIALLCAIWGSTWFVIRVGLADVPPMTLAAVRFTLGTAIFWMLARPLARLEGGARPPLWMVALFGSFNLAASYGLLYWAETLIPSSLAAVLWAVFPMMMAVAGHLFLPGERLRGAQWLGFVAGFVGVVLLFQTDLRGLSGEALRAGALLLLAPAVSAIGQTAVKLHGQGTSSVLLNRDGLTLATAYLWVLALATERGAAIEWTGAAVFSIVYLALVGTCAAFGLYFWVLRYTASYKMSLIAYVTPVIAIGVGWSLGEEPVHASTFAGLGLILGGVALVRR